MRKYLMVSLALIFALGSAFAFRQTTYQFRFDGDPADWLDRVDEDMYTKVASHSCIGPEEKLCKLVTTDANSDNKPDIGTSGSLFNALKNSEQPDPNFLAVGVVGDEE